MGGPDNSCNLCTLRYRDRSTSKSFYLISSLEKIPLWDFFICDKIRVRKQGEKARKMVKFRENLERERES